MPSQPVFPRTMSVPDAGRILGLSRNGSYAAASRGELPTIRIGRKLVVPTHLLFEFLDSPRRQASTVPPVWLKVVE